jgi:hypothetical protein
MGRLFSAWYLSIMTYKERTIGNFVSRLRVDSINLQGFYQGVFL